jgi:hypothetical protein
MCNASENKMLCAACVWMFQDLSKKGTHHHSYDNLAKAAKSGCKICIYFQMFRLKTGPEETEEMSHPFTTYFWKAWGADSNSAANFELTIQSAASWFNNQVSMRSGILRQHVSGPAPSPQWLPQFLEWVSRDLQTVPWNVREDGFDSRPIPESTGDPKVMELGLEWLETCINNHARCEAIDETRQPGYYPSRLLDVGTLECDKMRLVQTDVEHPTKGSRYATLSHCWGQHVSFLRLTADNITSLSTEIPPESLPRSFADAIVACRRLHIRYLWIDSLCILQSGPGSEEDWQNHVRDMHVIYANCVLDLVIAHAANPEEGAFVTRNPLFIRTAHVYAPAKMGLHKPQAYVDRAMEHRSDGSDKRIVGPGSFLDDAHTQLDRANLLRDHTEHCLVTIFVPQYDWSTSLTDQPLWKRGWVYQERLMTPRMLVFGNDRIYWQCHERMENEYLPHGLPGSGEPYDEGVKTPFTLTESVLRSKPPSTLTDEELCKLHLEWYKIVDNYSMTELTYPEKDKLAAIAAVAARFDRVIPGRYCAGLFEADLLNGLLWVLSGDVIADGDIIADPHWDMIERSLVIQTDIERGAGYRAPTWSWASVDEKTTFCAVDWACNGDRFCSSWYTLATVNEVSIGLQDPGNPYGQVTSAELVITGILIPLIDIRLGQDEEQGLFALLIKEEMRCDDDDKDGTGPTYSWLYGIVLSNIGGNTYQRKGHFTSTSGFTNSRFQVESYEEKTIRII